MAFFGPGFTLNTKPKWRQKWWWKERLPGSIAISVVVVLAVAAGVVGWKTTGDDDSGGGAVPSDTAGSPTATVRPSGSPTPTEQPPQFPDEARRFSAAGLEATVRYETKALNYAQRTGDFDPVKKVYSDECGFCSELVKSLTNTLKDGARYTDSDYVITSLEIKSQIKEDGGAYGWVDVTIKQPKMPILVDSNGKELDRFLPEPELTYIYKLDFNGNHWVILSIDGESKK